MLKQNGRGDMGWNPRAVVSICTQPDVTRVKHSQLLFQIVGIALTSVLRRFILSVKLVEVIHDGGKAGEVIEDPSGRRGAGHWLDDSQRLTGRDGRGCTKHWSSRGPTKSSGVFLSTVLGGGRIELKQWHLLKCQVGNRADQDSLGSD